MVMQTPHLRLLFVMLLCCLSSYMQPQGSIAQSESSPPVSLQLRDIPLRYALSMLAEQGRVRLIYADDLVTDVLITIHFKGLSVDQALNRLLRHTPLTFRKLQNDHVVLMRRTQSSLITGRVVDRETGQSLTGASVFLANTTMGAMTDADGRYRITQVPPSAYTLIVSHIGYELRTIPVQLIQPDTLRYYSRLKPRVLDMEEVQVTADRPKSGQWRKDLKKFTEEFIGTSTYAQACRIINPDVLWFSYDKDTGVFQAFTDSLLYVENRAFGYRMAIILNAFQSGEDGIIYSLIPRFEFLAPDDPYEQTEWLENRREGYQGSLKHFLSALVRNRFKEERFRAWAVRDPGLLGSWFGQMPISPETGPNYIHRAGLRSKGISYISRFAFENKTETELSHTPVMTGDNVIVAPDTLGLSRVTFDNYLAVEFGPEHSLIKLNKVYALVDTLGHLYIPFAFTTYGAWGQEAIGDMLPADYTSLP